MKNMVIDYVFLLPLLISAMSTIAMCHYARQLGVFLKLLDRPDGKAHASHTAVVPLTGGIAVFSSLALGGLAKVFLMPAAPIDNNDYIRAWFLSAMTAMLVLGVLDDRHQLSPRRRLFFMITICATTALLPEYLTIRSLNFPLFGWTLQLGAWNGLFTVLSLVALINAVNMADGRNGVILGMGIVWCIALLLNTTHLQTAFLAALLVGLCIAMYYNLRGKLFMGDGGAYALAFSLGLFAVWGHNQAPEAITTLQVASLFVIPILDMIRLIFVRLSRGQSPMSADHDHLHHRIERFVPWRYGLTIYLAMVALPIVIAFSGPEMGLAGLLTAFSLYGVVWLMTRAHAQSPIGMKPSPGEAHEAQHWSGA